jgi:lysozyme
MKISDNGVSLIALAEGIKLSAYKCQAGVVTIGIGTTKIDGKSIKMGTTCTQEQAYSYLNDFIENEIYPTLDEYVKSDLTQNQFDALCSFIYNIGTPQFITSTLLKMLNISNFKGASDQFMRWDKVNGKPNKGLLNRRKLEKQLFDKEV